MAHRTPPDAPTGQPTGLIILAAVLLVLGLAGAGVALAFAHWAPESITGLLLAVGSLAGGLLPVLGKLIIETRQQNQALTEIHEATNGRLDRRIKEAVRDAINESQSGQSTEDSGPKGLAA